MGTSCQQGMGTSLHLLPLLGKGPQELVHRIDAPHSNRRDLVPLYRWHFVASSILYDRRVWNNATWWQAPA